MTTASHIATEECQFFFNKKSVPTLVDRQLLVFTYCLRPKKKRPPFGERFKTLLFVTINVRAELPTEEVD